MQAVDPPRCLLRHAQRFHYDTASRLYFQSMTFVSGAGDVQQTISCNPANQIVSRSGAASATLAHDPLGRFFEAVD